MVLAIFGCIFGVLGIFTIGLIFVPLAALCALLGFFSGLSNRRPSAVMLAIVAGILAVVGWGMSPSLWVMTALLMAPSAHKDGATTGVGNVAPVVAAPVVPSTVVPSVSVPRPAIATTDDPEVASFNSGKRDRTAWEQFTGGITGEERDGALWWAGQRSLKAPGSCSISRSKAYRQGCEEAQVMLGPFDVLRKASRSYRAGWNSFLNPAAN